MLMRQKKKKEKKKKGERETPPTKKEKLIRKRLHFTCLWNTVESKKFYKGIPTTSDEKCVPLSFSSDYNSPYDRHPALSGTGEEERKAGEIGFFCSPFVSVAFFFPFQTLSPTDRPKGHRVKWRKLASPVHGYFIGPHLDEYINGHASFPAGDLPPSGKVGADREPLFLSCGSEKKKKKKKRKNGDDEEEWVWRSVAPQQKVPVHVRNEAAGRPAESS